MEMDYNHRHAAIPPTASFIAAPIHLTAAAVAAAVVAVSVYTAAYDTATAVFAFGSAKVAAAVAASAPTGAGPPTGLDKVPAVPVPT